MERARIKVDPDFWIGELDPRLYGSLIEHLGRADHGGLYEPEHPSADALDFRGDVLELVRDLRARILELFSETVLFTAAGPVQAGTQRTKRRR